MKHWALVAGVLALLVGCKEKREWGIDSFLSAGELHQMCSSNNPSVELRCMHYILGVIDAHISDYSDEKQADWLCGKPQVVDLLRAADGYLAAHPEKSASAAAPQVIKGVDAAYGCEGSGRK